MANFTLLQLRDQVRQRSDIVRSNHITDSEINGYINASIRELYDLLIQKFGEDYFVTSSNLSLISGTESYALPSNFYKLLGADLEQSSAEFLTLKPFMFNERNRFNSSSFRNAVGSESLRYRIQGNTLFFRPIPTNTATVRVYYVPQFGGLSLDVDLWDGYNGWEEYVVVDGTIKCKAKEESDVNVEAAQKGALIKRIEDVAGNRDAGLSFRVSDVRGINNEQGFGFNNND